MTFSIVARCAQTGQLGAAVSSSSPAVAARCIRTRAAVGAVASQNITDPSLADKALDLMARGATAAQAVNAGGLRIFRAVEKADANICLSPYSIQAALAMTYAGARRRTWNTVS